MTAPKATGGDLYHLWRVANVHLPRIADVFYDASLLLGSGRSAGGQRDDDAFRKDTPAYPGATYGHGMSSSVGMAWDMLRDEMQQGFAQVRETVLEGAAGVRQAITDYLEVDGDNSRNLLNVYLADPNNHNANDPASNPPSYDDPGAPEPGVPDPGVRPRPN